MPFPIYSIAADTANGKINRIDMFDEIEAAGPYTTTFERITVSGPTEDVLTVVFDAPPSVGDQAIVDGVVAAHQGDDPEPRVIHVSATKRIQATVRTVFVEGIGGPIVLTLPRPGLYPDVAVLKIVCDSSVSAINTVTLDPAAGFIAGNATLILTTPFAAVQLVPNPPNWIPISLV